MSFSGHEDITVRTALLEARLILGDRTLFEDMRTRFEHEIVQGTAAEFVAAKLAERDSRIVQAGRSRYLVEPNVKNGKGGLRILIRCFGSPNMSIGCAKRPISSAPACFPVRI